MINAERQNTMNLLQEAKKFGFLESEMSIQCSNCNVVFPKQYEKCPQCDSIQIMET